MTTTVAAATELYSEHVNPQWVRLAFQQAEALADALAAADLRRYEAAHRQAFKRPAFMADFMLLMDRSRWLRNRALPALAARPDLFANLLAMHAGKLGIAGFMSTSLRLGWKMV